MAREYAAYTQRGATVAALVIDTPAQNAAMVAKLALPFPVLSDPGGAGAIQALDAWDASGKMAKPAIIALAPDGREVYRYVGADFMDRPGDTDLCAALDTLGLPPLETPADDTIIAHLEPQPGAHAVQLQDLAPYLRGVRYASLGLARRARDDWDKSEAERTSQMAERYVAALGATQRLTNGAR